MVSKSYKSINPLCGIYIFTFLIIRWTGLIDSPKKNYQNYEILYKARLLTMVFTIISFILYYMIKQDYE